MWREGLKPLYIYIPLHKICTYTYEARQPYAGSMVFQLTESDGPTSRQCSTRFPRGFHSP